MNNEKERTKIIVQNWSGEKDILTLTIHWDSDIDEYVNVFKTILVWLGFHMRSIDSVVDNSFKELNEREE